MIELPITALYAGLLGLVFIALEVPIGLMRTRTGVSLHDGGNKELSVAIRRHANFVEHVPLALILLGLLEQSGASPGLLHGLGAALLLARMLHPFGLDYDKVRNPLRGIGAFTTMVVTLVASIVLVWGALTG
jgi:uncharacterized membrane protein YecN with MAPEG domain